jgi:hypothetical protein
MTLYYLEVRGDDCIEECPSSRAKRKTRARTEFFSVDPERTNLGPRVRISSSAPLGVNFYFGAAPVAPASSPMFVKASTVTEPVVLAAGRRAAVDRCNAAAGSSTSRSPHLILWP